MTLIEAVAVAGPWFAGLTLVVLGLLALVAVAERLWR